MRRAYQLITRDSVVAAVTFGWAAVDTASSEGLGNITHGILQQNTCGPIANRWAAGRTATEPVPVPMPVQLLAEFIQISLIPREEAYRCRLCSDHRPLAMCKYVLIAALAVMCSVDRVRATLHDLPGVFDFDFSNVDLVNFQYFKNLPSQDPRTAATANPFLEHFQKKKAVLDYLDRLFFGNSPFQQPSEIPFDPHFGRAWRPVYERKFGHRGERLIAALGSGYSIRQLRHFGAIPQEFGTPHYPS